MDNTHHEGNNLGNGFVLGVVVGVVIALLFSTKKGREILRTLTEEGLSKVSNLEDLLKEESELEEEDTDVDGDDYIQPEEQKEIRYLASEEAHQEKEELSETLTQAEERHSVHEAHEEKRETESENKTNGGVHRVKKLPRFFRGIPKKS